MKTKVKLKPEVENFFNSCLAVCADNPSELKPGDTGVYRWFDMIFDRYKDAGAIVGKRWLLQQPISGEARASADDWCP
jgi:hypothetical protein